MEILQLLNSASDHNTLVAVVVSVLVGTILPGIIGLILPRRKTIGYGMLIYNTLGTLLLQKRAHLLGMPTNVIGSLLLTVRSTLADLSFGIYIASRKDLTKEQVQQKIEEYVKQIGA